MSRPRSRLALLLVCCGCGTRVEASRPVGTEFIEVDYPPPPAQIEELTEALPGRPDCRFIDGHYSWQGRRWEWVKGQWMVPPPGCSRAPGSLWWSKTVPPRLYYTPPSWYSTSVTQSPAKPAPCPQPIPCQSPEPPRPP